jgi:hypothetical protein
MHDESKDEDLETEGLLNQTNILWFGGTVSQNQDFFFNPPRNQENKIADTRTPRMLDAAGKAKLRSSPSQLQFRDPLTSLANGFRIQVEFQEKERQLATNVLEHFVDYLSGNNSAPVSTRFNDPAEGEPHAPGSWAVELPTSDRQTIRNLGVAIAWLMCNRQGLFVSFQPTPKMEPPDEGQVLEECSFFIGDRPVVKPGSIPNGKMKTRA